MAAFMKKEVEGSEEEGRYHSFEMAAAYTDHRLVGGRGTGADHHKLALPSYP